MLVVLRDIALNQPGWATDVPARAPGLVARLFALMAHKANFEAAVAIAEEILACGPGTYKLQAVPSLAQLVASLPPRNLALLCRVLVQARGGGRGGAGGWGASLFPAASFLLARPQREARP